MNDQIEIHTDSTFHDVFLVCADGVEIGACRSILASRSAVFKEMLYENMQEPVSGRVSFQDIKSTAMHAVLRFIHTEDIDSNAVSVAVEVYRAARFFLLPELMQLVLDRVHDITDFGVAASLLNDATASEPRNDFTKELFDAVFKPFCANPLAVGDLNELSEKALELLLMHSDTVIFKTSEYILLLCVIEWVWAHDTLALPAAERRAIFDHINSLPTKPSVDIRLQSEWSRTLLLKLLDYFDLSLVCPHRLKCLIKSTNVFKELPQHRWVFYYQICEFIMCDPTHPSRFRGEPSPFKPQWDHSNLERDLIFSEGDIVVEYPMEATSSKTVRASPSARISADRDGILKWTIVVDSLCSNGGSEVGVVSQYWNNHLEVEWSLKSIKNSRIDVYVSGARIGRYDGCFINDGDAVTFHLDLKSHICALSINGLDYGVVWSDFNPNISLYPAVGLRPGNKYRIKSS